MGLERWLCAKAYLLSAQNLVPIRRRVEVADKGSEDRKDIHKGFLSAIIDVKSDVPVALSSHTSPIYGLP
jgi:hypothetical protein